MLARSSEDGVVIDYIAAVRAELEATHTQYNRNPLASERHLTRAPRISRLLVIVLVTLLVWGLRKSRDVNQPVNL